MLTLPQYQAIKNGNHNGNPSANVTMAAVETVGEWMELKMS